MLRSMNCFRALPSSVPSFICEHGAFLPLSFCLFYALVAGAASTERIEVFSFTSLAFIVTRLRYHAIVWYHPSAFGTAERSYETV